MANEQDKDNDMQENKKDKSRKSAIITGVICVLLCIIGALYIWHKQTQKPPVQLDVNSAIATVDIDKLMSKHSDYAKLEKLQAEKILILIKLKSYALNTEQLQPPQVNPASQVFEQVVDEQNNLQEIKTKQQLKEETITKEHEIRQRLSIEKNKAETLITDKYTNAIFNCTMKLDNAENLRLTQEEKDNLLTLLEQLKKERGENVALIEQQYNLKVADELMKWRAQREQELGINVQKIHQIDVQNSLERQQAEQKREAQYLQDRLQMLQARKKDSERLIILLHTKENEINLLKRSILKDIASKAMKIAIQKHLKLVIADAPATLDFFGNIKIDNFDDTVLNGMVVGVDAIDITDDVMAELTNEQMQNNNGK